MARKPIAIDADLHAVWTAEAKRQGVSLATYVTTAVERLRTGTDAHLAKRPVANARVKPADCTNRVPKGTYCKVCGATHR